MSSERCLSSRRVGASVVVTTRAGQLTEAATVSELAEFRSHLAAAGTRSG